MSGTFRLRSLHGYDVKSPYRYFTFHGEKEQNTTKFYFSSLELNSRKNMPTFYTLDMPKFIAIKFEKA